MLWWSLPGSVAGPYTIVPWCKDVEEVDEFAECRELMDYVVYACCGVSSGCMEYNVAGCQVTEEESQQVRCERGRGQKVLWIESFGVHPDQTANMGDRQSIDLTGGVHSNQAHQVRTRWSRTGLGFRSTGTYPRYPAKGGAV